MFARIARMALDAPRQVVGTAALITICAGVFGFPVINSLSSGGFEDPGAESSRAADLLTTKFGRGDLQMLLTVTSERGATSSSAKALGRETAQRLATSDYVSGVVSAWTSPPSAANALISKDGKTGLVVAGIRGGGSEGQKHAKELADALVKDRDGVTIAAGGPAVAYAQINHQSERDLRVTEAIAIPLCFFALVWVFGGLLAALLPLAVGIAAIIGVTAVLQLITAVTEVSTFALNLTLAMGLALAVDYTLLIVSRFRDELAVNDDPECALIVTMNTAGRTVLFSALTVAMSMTALALFPMYFMRSFAYAGAAVVALTATTAIVVTPAALVVLGDQLDAFDVRRLARRLLRRPDPAALAVEQSFWYRTTKTVMRNAYSIGLAIVVLLVVIGSPFKGVKWGFPDDRVLPQSASSRQVGDELRAGFGVNPMRDLTVVVPDSTGVSGDELGRYAARVSTIRDVASVSSPAGTFTGGRLVGPPSAPTGMKDGRAYLTVHSTAALSSTSDAQLRRLHNMVGPAGKAVQITGLAQISHDTAASISARLPLVLAVIATITFVLLFALTGSIVIPVKALVLNVLSLTATFGALVWIFQDGHLNGLGTTTSGTLVASIPILLFCIAFGLSMDYEVFLISRIREQWLASAQTGKDNDECVAVGLACTGRVVTAAALVMSISFAALSAADVSIVRMFGVGLTLAVAMDATLVRMCLVPAFMHVLGAANWWAPQPLRHLHRRFSADRSQAARRVLGSATAPTDRAPCVAPGRAPSGY
jgi:RND superfamily putative drug exporter